MKFVILVGKDADCTFSAELFAEEGCCLQQPAAELARLAVHLLGEAQEGLLPPEARRPVQNASRCSTSKQRVCRELDRGWLRLVSLGESLPC